MTPERIEIQSKASSRRIVSTRVTSDLSIDTADVPATIAVSDPLYRSMSVTVGDTKFQDTLVLSRLTPHPLLAKPAIAQLQADGRMLLLGFIGSETTGDALPGVTVAFEPGGWTTVTTAEGFFSLSVPASEIPDNAFNSLTVSKEGFRTLNRTFVETWSRGVMIYTLTLAQGIGAETIDQRGLRRRNSDEESLTAPSASYEVAPYATQRSVLTMAAGTLPPRIPTSVRVNTGTSVLHYNLEDYLTHVLPAEWKPVWGDLNGGLGMEALYAGAIAARTYSIGFVNNPDQAGYDICATISCQVFDKDVSSPNTTAAINATTGQVLVDSSGNITKRMSEFAAETVDQGCGSDASGEGTTVAPCLSDLVCSGLHDSNSHGRGMCQNGSARWASGYRNVNTAPHTLSGFGTHDADWILQHYYLSRLTKVSGQQLTIGSSVRVNGTSSLSVRDCNGGIQNGVNCSLAGTVTTAATGTVVGGPQLVETDGLKYTWWRVSWGTGITGWSAENWLQFAVAGSGAANFLGTVTDGSTGHTISGASVTWGSASAATDAAGVYSFSFVPCQTASLTVSRSGYLTSTQPYTPQCNSSNVPKDVALTPTGGICSAAFPGGVSVMASSCSSVPVVTTTAATNITSNSATFNATINSDGGSTILERRFDWGISPAWTDATNLNGGTIVVSGNNFSYSASGLTPGTFYQFRAWARNSSGWAPVGNGLTFTTGTIAPPVCTSFTINPSSASPNASANSQSVTVTGSPAGCQGGNWNASGNGSWLTVSPSNGNGSASTTVFWSQNPFTSSRTDSATIAGRTFTVTQSGTVAPVCTSFTISPSSSSPSAAAGSQPVTVNGNPAGCQGGSWSAAGNGSWLNVSPSTGFGPGSTTVFWSQNPLTSSRADSASIAGSGYSVTQSAATGSSAGSPHPFSDVPGAAVQLHDIGVGPDGSIFVLYPTSNPNTLAVVKSTDGGASWGSPVVIPNSNYNDLFHLAVDSSGVVHVVWGFSNGNTEAYYSRSTNGGASFSSPIQVRTGNSYNGFRTNNATEPVVASDGAGNVYVAYGAFTKDGAGNFVGYNVWVSQSTNGGASFQPEFSINTISSTQKIPRKIRATSSNIYVLYMDETNNDVYFYRRSVGATSGDTVRLNTKAGSVQSDGDFVLSPNEMTVYGAYSDTTGDSEGNITLCKSTDGGITWPACRRVNDIANRQQHTPRIGLDGLGNLHIAWADGRANGRLQIYYAYSTDGGTTFSTNTNLSSPVTQTDFSQTHVAIDNPNSAVYVSATRNYSQVVVARLLMTPASQDTTAPAGSVIINNGNSATASSNVLLSLSASDAVGVVGYYVSNSSAVPSAGQSGWASVSSTTSLVTTLNGWQVTAGDSFKIVYVWFKDAAGNVSSTASAGINLDQTPPSNGALSAVPGDHQVLLSWGGQVDVTTSIGGYKLVFVNGNTPPSGCSGVVLATSSPFVHTGLNNQQSYSYRVCATDVAGNTNIGATATAIPNVTQSAAPSSFYVVTPCRIIDTRDSTPLGNLATRDVTVSGVCGIPQTAVAVFANITAVAPATGGFLAFYPTGSTWPGNSTLNYRTGKTRANNAILTLSGGKTTVMNNGSAQNFIIDVTGYFQ